MINEGIAVVELAELNSNRSKIPIKYNIYNRTYGWFKTGMIITGYNQVTTSDGLFQIVGTSIMLVDEVSHRAIIPVQEFRNMSRWS